MRNVPFDPAYSGSVAIWQYLSGVRLTARLINCFKFYNAFTEDSSLGPPCVRPGDFLALTNSSGTRNGHSGIALAVSDDYKWVWTAEGNVGDCVAWKRRPYFTNGVLNPDIDGVGNIDVLF